jgi:pSer/pThr/pTyr-binding forkhead associated (FHA) protein
MLAASDRCAPRLMDEETVFGPGRAAPAEIDVMLEPLSRPELGEIRIDCVLAVGRNEPAFAGCGNDVLAMLSRRHARLFCEAGSVYVADLQSRNGTSVNRNAVGQQPWRLADGDEVSFGGALSYRVRITPRADQGRSAGALTLTLTPESTASGPQAIIVTRFPFLIGKADPAFVRSPGVQLGYLSRRHAHVFLKGGQAWIEDLASTNGTFVDGMRLQEHAVPLHDGELIAFGGDHFTYRVGIAKAASIAAVAPAPALAGSTGTQPAPAAAQARSEPQPVASDKTTFIVAPTSFLEIFCAETGPGAAAAPATLAPAAARRSRPRVGVVAELFGAFTEGEGPDAGRLWRWGAALAAVAGAAVVALSLGGAFDPSIKELIDRGEHARAATLADQALERRPDDAEVRALATEAALKAHVPTWLDKVAAGDVDGARAALGTLTALGQRNPDLGSLVAELEWLGQLQQLLAARGGPDQPIRIFADEQAIAALLERWNRDTGTHQRALARVASVVPPFGAPYGEALTQLRKLQSDATVHLAAIERLKAALAAELERDRPQALEPMLKDYASRYPGLGGLDSVREDLTRLLAIRDARAGRGRLFALLRQARFATPPFQQAFAALTASGQLPPAALVRQYDASTERWIDGDSGAAIAELQRIAPGPWSDTLGAELQRRQGVLAQFAALQRARAAGGYIDQLLAFREALDPVEDLHFVRATQAELAQQKEPLTARARQSLMQARALWQEYRDGGPIEAAHRIETTISPAFRAKARLLADASRHAQQGAQIQALVRSDAADAADPSAAIGDEIRAEAQLQRHALQDLRNVLEPELLRNKLAVLGGTVQ